MEEASTFKIDLVKIEGDGEFPCPSCGEIISPDDESEDIYDIIAIKTKEDDSIEEVQVQCKKCGSVIHLVGFEALNVDNLDDLFDLSEYLIGCESVLGRKIF